MIGLTDLSPIIETLNLGGFFSGLLPSANGKFYKWQQAAKCKDIPKATGGKVQKSTDGISQPVETLTKTSSTVSKKDQCSTGGKAPKFKRRQIYKTRGEKRRQVVRKKTCRQFQQEKKPWVLTPSLNPVRKLTRWLTFTLTLNLLVERSESRKNMVKKRHTGQLFRFNYEIVR